MGAIIGPHIINGLGSHKDVLKRWKPRLITVLDPKPDEMQWVHDNLPDTTIVGRIYVEDGNMSNRIQENPEKAAEWAHNLTLERYSPHVTYWQVANEVHQSWEGIQLLNRFELRRMELADAETDKQILCGIGAFSVGNPDMPEHDRMALWREFYPALEYAEQNSHICIVHQYGQPDLWGPDDPTWFIERLEVQVIPKLPFRHIKFAVCEYGIDGLIWSPDGKARGWMHFTDALGYANQLINKGGHNEQWSNRIIGYSVFTLGQNPPWQTYDIVGEVANLLATHYESASPPVTPPVPPPNGPPQPPTPPPVQPPSPPSAYTPRVSQPALDMNVSWVQQAGGRWRLKDLFTTQDGKWDVDASKPFGLPQWARDEYLSWEFDDAGADHHIFARFEDMQGDPIDTVVRFYVPTGPEETKDTAEKDSGWQNIPLFSGGSDFSPDKGEQGPWQWGDEGENGTRVKGGGLPWNWHVSTFAVFQEYVAVPEPPIDPPIDPPIIDPPPAPTDLLQKPVLNPYITQKWMANPQNYEQFGLPGHNGVDYGGQAGDHILAPADGEVARVGEDKDYGSYIRIWHPKLRIHTFYAHLSKTLVKVGGAVRSGMLIAEMGSTGNSTGPHLHFEIRLAFEDGYYQESTCAGMPRGRVDPEQWFEVQNRVT